MKQIYSFLLSFISLAAFAQTLVPNGNVQGNWTLANSPYMIQGDINVPNGQSLNIEPGVEVIFEGLYYLHVYGILDAEGTANQPILFRAQDTTGWYVDSLPIGGWRGIYFDNSIVGDSSELKYCHFQDTKNGVVGQNNVLTAGCVRAYRGLHISYCKFYHNQSTQPQTYGNIIAVELPTGQTFEMDHCEVYDNFTRISAILATLGDIHIYENKIHHNKGGGAALRLMFCHLVLEENEIYENESAITFPAIQIMYSYNSKIFHNKIHHNKSDKFAALVCSEGRYDIDANLICNNEHHAGNCGVQEGGGAIHIAHFGTIIPYDSCFFLIRNNVLANNYSSHGGGGVYVIRAKAKIMNNHFVNNSAILGGAIMCGNPDTELEMKNNLFYGNLNDNAAQPYSIIIVHAATKIVCEYNWMTFPFSQSVTFPGAIPAILDTANNVLGTNPFLIAPTTSILTSDDATIANFDLASNSACINAGDSDTTGCYVTPKDFINNPRLVTLIDIGAFEHKGATEGIVDFSGKNESLYISPNPAQDKISLVLPEKNGKLTLFDMTGKQVLEVNAIATEMQLNLPILPAGIYMMIWEKNGKQIVDKLVISSN